MARLSRAVRREQLLDLGAEMITEVGFDQFSTDDLAARAGISRSLFFHYFPTRNTFLIEVVERAAQEVLDVTDPDPDLPAPAQLLQGITGFLDYIEDKGDQYVALVRGAAGGDPALQAIFRETRDTLADRLVAGASQAATSEVPHLAVLAARGQIALAEEVFVGWLTSPADVREPRDRIVLFLSLSMVDLLRRSGVELDPELVALLPG